MQRQRQPTGKIPAAFSTRLMLAVMLAAACNPELSERQRAAVQTETVAGTVTNGVVTADLAADSDAAQQIAGSGGVSGSTITFPPGSLAVNTSLTVEEGEDLAASAAGLGIAANSLTAASASILVGSSQSVDPVTAFTVSLPLSGAALALLQSDPYAKLVLLHKRVEYSVNQTYVGILTRSMLTIADGMVTFETKHFGVFQAVITTELVTEMKSAVTAEPIQSKTAAAAAAAETEKPLTLAFKAVSPGVMQAGTTFTLTGTVDAGTQTVEIHGSAACTSVLASGTKAQFEGTGIEVTITANTKVTFYALAKAAATSSRAASSCTKLVAVESDMIAPAAPVVTVPSATSSRQPTWTWTKPAGANGTYRYKLDSAELGTGATETTATTYTPTSNLTEGTHTLYLQARDAAGNWSVHVAGVTAIDATAPVVTIDTPTDGEYVPEKTFAITGTCDSSGLAVTLVPGSGLSAVDTTVACVGGEYTIEGVHSVVAPASAASMTFSVTQADGVGNSATTPPSRAYFHGLDPSSMELWLDAANVTAASGFLSAWPDKRVSTPKTVTLVNTLNTGTINGKPTVVFTAANAGGVKITDMTSAFDPSTQNLAIFVVFQTSTANAGVLVAKARYNSSTAYDLFVDASDLQLALGSSTVFATRLTGVDSDSPRVISMVSQPSVPLAKLYDAATNTMTGNLGTAGSETASAYPVVIGAKCADTGCGLTGSFDGKISEVLIYYRAVSSAERERIAAYLKQKWVD